MAISVVATSVNVSNNVGVDCGAQDDILYATVKSGNSGAAITPPAGWTVDQNAVVILGTTRLSTWWIKRSTLR